ncbi:hypothetical protein OY671_008450 [Metschnikowia pulcherrima]|nr:hypothetical protein OY671_008450 [Metschnikowia pulcherrima]
MDGGAGTGRKPPAGSPFWSPAATDYCGGGGGIGATICQESARAGYRVVVSDVDAQRAGRVADELGAPHSAHAFDVSDENAVEMAFDQIEQAHGPIAVSVSAAGSSSFQANGERPSIKDTTLDIWERSFAVNARGVFSCGRAYSRRREAAPLQHGRIVTFTSVAAQSGGSISAEHGIGRLKQHAFSQYKPAVSVDVMQRIKHALDPRGTFNPGRSSPRPARHS